MATSAKTVRDNPVHTSCYSGQKDAIDAPPADQLAATVGDVLAESPDLGVKKIVALIKQTRPDLAPLTNA